MGIKKPALHWWHIQTKRQTIVNAKNVESTVALCAIWFMLIETSRVRKPAMKPPLTVAGDAGQSGICFPYNF